MRSLALDVRYDSEALAAIPQTGPVVVVANHPYGVLDGIVISWLVSKVRSDFVVLTNAVLMRAPEVQDFILPIDFSETEEAQQTNLASRAAARAQLEKGGVVVVFPAGAVSTAPDKLGRKPAVDGRWQPFVSQLIQRSKATVVPIWFGGQNSRLFQIASHVSHDAAHLADFPRGEVEDRDVAPGRRSARRSRSRPSPAIKDRQALADELCSRVYALARRAPSEGEMRGRGGKFLPPAVRAAFRQQRAA